MTKMTKMSRELTGQAQAMLAYRNSDPASRDDRLHREDARRLAEALIGLATNIIHSERLGHRGDEKKTERAVNRLLATRSNINHPFDGIAV